MAAPVIFFPGVAGSRLYFPEQDVFWDPDRYLRMWPWIHNSDEWVRKTLRWDHPAHVVLTPRYPMSKSRQQRGWGTASYDFHGGMLKELEFQCNRGLPREEKDRVYAVGYDWRQRINTTLADYAAGKCRKIMGKHPGEKIILLGYSMGALVIRAMLKRHADIYAAAKRLIYIFPPISGAPVAYRRMFTGMTLGYDGGLKDFAFQFIFGNTWEAFVGNMSSVPGPMQLHPSDYYVYSDATHPYWHPERGNYSTAQLYQHPNSPPGLYDAGLQIPWDAKAALQDRIQDIVDLHSLLGDPKTVSDPAKSYLLYGDKEETDVAVEYSSDPKVIPWKQPQGRSPWPDDISGDGTVPSASALSLGLTDATHVKRFKMIKHADACTKDAKDVCRQAAAWAAL